MRCAEPFVTLETASSRFPRKARRLRTGPFAAVQNVAFVGTATSPLPGYDQANTVSWGAHDASAREIAASTRMLAATLRNAREGRISRIELTAKPHDSIRQPPLG